MYMRIDPINFATLSSISFATLSPINFATLYNMNIGPWDFFSDSVFGTSFENAICFYTCAHSVPNSTQRLYKTFYPAERKCIQNFVLLHRFCSVGRNSI